MEETGQKSTPLRDSFLEQDEDLTKNEVSRETDFNDSLSESDIESDMDGGYGWIIVIASFFNAFIIDGIGSSFGLLFPFVMEKFETTAFVASFAGSLFVALLIMGSVSVELVRRFGFKSVCIAGGILSCLSLTASAFSPNIIVFILTFGLLAGCSCGLVFLPSIVLVNSYFHRRRGLANGIITSGSGAGLLVLAPFINALLTEYSLDGTILIMAGILLNMCVFSSFYRSPPLDPSQDSFLESEEKILCDAETGKMINSERLEFTKKMDFVNDMSNSDMFDCKIPKIEYPFSHTELRPTASGKAGNEGFPSVMDQNHTGKSIFRSEYQLDIKGHANGCQLPLLHSSVHNIPTWCQDKGQNHIPHNAMMKNAINGRRQCHQSPQPHHSHDQHQLHQSGHCLLDQGSHLYLAGSITTLKKLHFKHLLQDVLNTSTPDSVKISKAHMPGFEINAQNFPSKKNVLLVGNENLMNCQPDQDGEIQSLVLSDNASVISIDLNQDGEANEAMTITLPSSTLSLSQLLCLPTFHLFTLGASLIQLGYPIAGTFLADHAYQKGLTTYHTAVLMGLLGGFNICGRFFSGVLANLHLDPLHLHNVSLLLGGITCLLCPFYTEFWSLCVLASLFGLFLGFFPPLQPQIIVEFFGMGSLASAFGFLTTVKGVASILGAPVAGWIYDASGDYSYSFIFAGIIFVSSAIIHSLMPFCRKWKKMNGVDNVAK